MEKNNESFIRWQGRSLEELGRAINLILSLALATIGFSISKLLDKDFKFSNCSSKCFLICGNLILLLSVIIFLWVTFNRLMSFKKTTKIARKREKSQLENIEELRSEVNKHDKNTWCYFKLGIVLFCIGEISAIVGFAIELFSKK